MPNAAWRLPHALRRAFIAAVVLLLCVTPAGAQEKQQESPPQRQPQPIGPFIIDLRGLFVRHKQEPSVATELGVAPGNLPTRSFGVGGGAHVYPLRSRRVTIGLGGHVLIAGGSQTLAASTAGTPSPTVRRHFRTFGPEVSFNFGHRNGWSYISGGLGRSSLYVDREDAPNTSASMRKTIDYGAGARWFTHHRVAVSLEVRWFAVSPQAATATQIELPRTTLMVLSGGIAVR
jgi:hypothetical protein